jgi:ABC-type branched-subunit amino acid transport system substrate-binding protein
VSACTSSKPKGSNTSAGDPGGGGKPSGNDIVVAGVQDGNYAGIDVGFKARIARFNNAGGLDGRKINLLEVAKDGSSLTQNFSTVQSLVLKDHVFAVTPVSSQGFSPSSATLLTQHNIPLIGWGISPTMCIGDNAFPVLGCQASSKYQTLELLDQLAAALGKQIQGLKLAIIGIDNAGGKSGLDGVAAAARSAKANVVYAKATIPQGGATDYAPYVQGLLGANADAIMLLPDFATGAALTGALRQAGYRGAVWNPTAYVPGVLSGQPQLAAALNGSFVVTQFPPQEQDSPAVKQIIADLKGIGAPSNLTLGVSVGWWSAEQFIQQLQATAAKGEVTSANFVKTIHAGWTIKPVDGGISGLSFPGSQVKPAGCGGLMTAQAKGTYSVAEKYACDPSTVVQVSDG